MVGEAEIAAVTALLRARRLSMGAEVEEFERETAARTGRAHGVAISSGTAALDIALHAAGIGAGDSVLVCALSYISGPNAILRRGARPVFCDVEPTSLNVDPADIERRLSPDVRAILVADYCGAPADYDRLVPLAREAGVPLIVDAAQSLLATHRGRPTCAFGTAATTSFHAAKPIACGEGGMVLTDDPDLAADARRIRNQGQVTGRKYVHDMLGLNARMTELSAAIGRAQLAEADAVVARRDAIAARYWAGIAEIPEVRPVRELPDTQPCWFSIPMLVPERDVVARRLARAGIETRSLYPVPVYAQPMPEYREYAGERRAVAEWAARRIINLPLYREMADQDVDRVLEALRGAVRVRRRR